MIPGISNVKQNVQRFDEIVRVLAKYGLADWLGERGPSFVRRRFVTAEGEHVAGLPVEVRIRMALTELGTTFIKLGQMMSQRPDMVGPELAAELESLQADTPADPPEVVRDIIEGELGAPLDELFSWIDLNALASASVGQVHLAALQDGTNVVVKVQHAGIEEKVQGDLNLLSTFARIAENNSRELGRYRPTATVAEFRRSLLRELDFGTELSNLIQFARNFEEVPGVHFPEAYPEFSSRRVLTMEKMDGYSIANLRRMAEEAVDREIFAQRFGSAMLKMVFTDGFYHADPHPGNIFVLVGERVGFLDCGKVGRVDEQTQDDFINIVQAFLSRDVDRLTDELIRLCEVPPDLDRSTYRADVAEFVGEFAKGDAPIDLSAAFQSMFGIIRRHHLVVPARVNMLLLVLVQMDGTARLLDPKFNLADALQSFGSELVWRRISPARLQREVTRLYRDLSRFIRVAPRETLGVLEQLRSGDLHVHVHQHGIEKPLNRLTYGIMTSALLLGSSVMWAVGAKPTLFGVSVFGFLGVLLGLAMILYLLFFIWRSGNM
ncbi:MAG: AarF/ABC1/UbiB kinase family protein [Caldilineaceae bacterium]|nr:AarF/ABC1/UbiB kinase family protein [Caldilineaceae bacterium]